MAVKLAIVEAPMPRRGRISDVDLDLMQEIDGMIGKASAQSPLTTGETYPNKAEAVKAANSLKRQLEKFRDDPRSRVATRAFVSGKEPDAWNPDDDKWQFGLYIGAPIKRSK